MKRAVLLLPLLLAACAGPHRAARERTGIPDLEPGELLTPQGRRVSESTFVQQARESRFVLIGEAHDSACDHRVQARLLAALARAGVAPAVGLEMVDVDRQGVLDRFNAGELTVADLETALDWPHTWGVPFRLYEPIFVVARDARVPVIALNLPEQLVQAVSKDEDTRDPRLPPEIIPPPGAQREVLKEAFDAHAHAAQADPGALDRFLRIQSLWDTQMATAALTHARKHDQRVVILAGAGHVQNGWGIAHRLGVLAPDHAVLAVMPWRGEEAIEEDGADLFAYCPE